MHAQSPGGSAEYARSPAAATVHEICDHVPIAHDQRLEGDATNATSPASAAVHFGKLLGTVAVI
jgi:hypothetical protein